MHPRLDTLLQPSLFSKAVLPICFRPKNSRICRKISNLICLWEWILPPLSAAICDEIWERETYGDPGETCRVRFRGRDYQEIALGDCMVDHSIAHYVLTVFYGLLCRLVWHKQKNAILNTIHVYGEMVQYHTCPKGGVNVWHSISPPRKKNLLMSSSSLDGVIILALSNLSIVCQGQAEPWWLFAFLQIFHFLPAFISPAFPECPLVPPVFVADPIKSVIVGFS